jgi:hypothetical protein
MCPAFFKALGGRFRDWQPPLGSQWHQSIFPSGVAVGIGVGVGVEQAETLKVSVSEALPSFVQDVHVDPELELVLCCSWATTV